MLQKLSFKKASINDLNQIISMYHQSFRELYEKYLDEDTNPYKESKILIKYKMQMAHSDYFFILKNNKSIGMIRILTDPKTNDGKVSPILILPEFQNQKLAQLAMFQIEKSFLRLKLGT